MQSLTTLDETQALLGMAQGLVPQLADVAVVDVVDDRGDLVRLGGAAAAHLNVELDELLARPASQHRDGGGPMTKATIAARQTVHLSGSAMKDATVLDAPSRQVLSDLGAREVLIVPLVGRERLCGVIGLVLVDRPSYDAEEIALVEEVGHRVGTALDNARRFSAGAQAGSILQRALLPDSLSHPVLEARATYRPSQDRYGVGGDWYDVVPDSRSDQLATLVIGDAAGHDLHAATTMAVVRNVLRGIAVATDHTPEQILAVADDNLAGLGVLATCSVVVVRCRHLAHGPWEITWCNAGHPPPILLTEEGPLTLSEVHGPLLGTHRQPARKQQSIHAAPGDVLLLYTDGLVDRRGTGIAYGIAELEAAAAGLAQHRHDLDNLLPRLLSSIAPSPEDDTAALAVAFPRRPTVDSIPSRVRTERSGPSTF